MKAITAFIAGVLMSFSFSQNDLSKVEETAYRLISVVVYEFTEPEEQSAASFLTESERAAVGRYFETPQLQEVYPGIGRALDANKKS